MEIVVNELNEMWRQQKNLIFVIFSFIHDLM